MLVTIIIPSFEQPQFLGAAIKSACSQDYRDLEIIVVDDASQDASLAVAVAVARQDNRVRVLRHMENGGLGQARNTGVVHAKGELLAFLDADDCLFPNSISGRVAGFLAAREDEPRCVGVFGDWQHTPELVDIPSPRAPRNEVADVAAEHFTGENGFICSAPLVTADAVRAVGGFPEGVALFEDFAMWSRILATGGLFRYVPVMASTYRQRPSSMLRRSDVIGGAHAAAIVDSMRDSGIDLQASSMTSSMVSDLGPRLGNRLSWLRSTEFAAGSTADLESVESVLASAPATDDASGPLLERPLALMDRTAESLETEVADCCEIETRGSSLVDDDAVSVVFVPTSLEAAFETRAIVDATEPSARQAFVIALTRDTSLVDVWPVADLTVRILDAVEVERRCTQASWVVFDDDLGERGALIARVGKSKCVVRTSGTTAYRVLEAGAAKRFRSAGRVLVRNRLEAAELGDRPVDIVQSGAQWGCRGLEPAGRDGPIVIFIPDGFIDEPVADGWISSALIVAENFSRDIVLTTGGPPVAQLGGFKVRPLSPPALSGAAAVVTPVCDEVTLFEALGMRPVVFEPSPGDSFSPLWLRHLSVARTAEALRLQVAEAIADSRLEVDSFASSLGAVNPHDGDLDEFARSFLQNVTSKQP